MIENIKFIKKFDSIIQPKYYVQLVNYELIFYDLSNNKIDICKINNKFDILKSLEYYTSKLNPITIYKNKCEIEKCVIYIFLLPINHMYFR